MNYEEEVRAAKEDVRRIDEAERNEVRGARPGDEHRWDLARRTDAVTAAGAVSVGQWARDIGRTQSQMSHYRDLWRHFGHMYSYGDPACPTFTEAWKVVVPADRTDRVQKRTTDVYLRRASPEEKAEYAASLLADPNVVAQAVAFGSPLSRALADAADTQRAQREDRVERLIEADPISQRQRSSTSVTELAGLLSRFAEDIAARLPRVRELPDPANDPAAQGVFLREALVRAETAVASVRALLTTGRVGGDVDQFVAGVLREEER